MVYNREIEQGGRAIMKKENRRYSGQKCIEEKGEIYLKHN